MQACQHPGGDRTRLDGFESDIFKLVREEATSEQWKEWLRVPLEHAVAKGNMDLFTRLMEAGADGSSGWRGCNGRTLLGSAVGVRSEEMVLALLKAGATSNLNVKFGERSESALHVAAAEGAEAVFATLMLAGADPDLQDGEGCSPLHVAAGAGHHSIVRELLLLKGAFPKTKAKACDNNDNTPLHLAAEKGNTRCIPELLLAGADIDSRNLDGQTPLFMAAVSGRLGAVQDLLDAGANLDLRAHSLMSPLDAAAAEGGHEDVVRILLRHGVDITFCDEYGYTALHWAAGAQPFRDNGGVVRMLLAAGADIEAETTGNRFTPLYFAAEGMISSSGTMHALLEGGANVNALDADNRTPLHLACGNSNVAGVRFLLRWGADENRTDDHGKTPADKLRSWDQDNSFDDGNSDKQRKLDYQCICRMLARAPADRFWRRRGWLVLCRDPTVTKVQLSTASSSNDSSAKVGQAGYGSRRGDDENSDDSADGVSTLVERVVQLEEEGIFRMVVGFL